MHLAFDKMTIADKLRAMEEIWDDLCHNAEQFELAEWHKEILDQREKAIFEGKEIFLEWETAKKMIREKL
ncbi:MAG: addiction module protein [Candidatus Riflebacteria bacterium]|nr:addiction module protein [Candidatus Riflebacteria bacterium]